MEDRLLNTCFVSGNVFVIAAILLERNLQNVANYLIVSLAVADLMVACLVMPLGAVYVVSSNRINYFLSFESWNPGRLGHVGGR